MLEKHSKVVLPFTVFILYLRDVSRRKSHNIESDSNDNSKQIGFVCIWYLISIIFSHMRKRANLKYLRAVICLLIYRGKQLQL